MVLFHNSKLLKINMHNNGVFIVFIPMVLFLWLKIAKKLSKIGIHGNL